MLQIYYHASHEQFSPSALRSYACAAERAGFDGVFTSDHLQPWSTAQGHSGFCWSWLGAALQATSTIPFATITPPIGLRYHPLVIAQAVATLADLFGERFRWFAVGSGEALNEAVLGRGWPDKERRNQMVQESAEVMRQLFRGDRVTHEGEIRVDDARLWCRPKEPPRIYGAAITEETAHWMGPWTDGLLTAGIDPGKVEAVVRAYRSNGGAGKPVALKVDLSWHEQEGVALREALQQWACTTVDERLQSELRTPEEFEKHSRTRTAEEMRAYVQIASGVQEHGERLAALAASGIDVLDLHNVATTQLDFISAFGPLLDALRKGFHK
jgi:coenzyme F420-dependent glucose-6-phosphate dehydrogenase